MEKWYEWIFIYLQIIKKRLGQPNLSTWLTEIFQFFFPWAGNFQIMSILLNFILGQHALFFHRDSYGIPVKNIGEAFSSIGGIVIQEI